MRVYGIVMGVNVVCTLKIDGKHDLFTLYLPEDKNKTQLSLSRFAREVADFSDVIKVWRRHTPLIYHIACMSILVIKTKIFVKNWKSPAANIRKMLLMKDYNSSPWLSILTRGVGIPTRDEAGLIPGRNFSPEGEISLSYMDWLMMDYFISLLVKF